MAAARAKSLPYLVLFQALLMAVAGYLISRMSFIGRIGINLFYKEYAVFKSAPKTAVLLFLIQGVLMLVQWLVHRRYDRKIANIVSVVLLVVALIGLFATYQDFQHTLSHRLLKERFHLGFYLFWIGWIGTCLYFMYGVRHTQPPFEMPEV
jgi:Mn2+/Fe2+ NRAMP family transporter